MGQKPSRTQGKEPPQSPRRWLRRKSADDGKAAPPLSLDTSAPPAAGAEAKHAPASPAPIKTMTRQHLEQGHSDHFYGHAEEHDLTVGQNIGHCEVKVVAEEHCADALFNVIALHDAEETEALRKFISQGADAIKTGVPVLWTPDVTNRPWYNRQVYVVLYKGAKDENAVQIMSNVEGAIEEHKLEAKKKHQGVKTVEEARSYYNQQLAPPKIITLLHGVTDITVLHELSLMPPFFRFLALTPSKKSGALEPHQHSEERVSVADLDTQKRIQGLNVRGEVVTASKRATMLARVSSMRLEQKQKSEADRAGPGHADHLDKDVAAAPAPVDSLPPKELPRERVQEKVDEDKTMQELTGRQRPPELDKRKSTFLEIQNVSSYFAAKQEWIEKQNADYDDESAEDGKGAAAPTPVEEAKEETGPREPDLLLLHFNDVYHIESIRAQDPVGGADRFFSVLESYRTPNRKHDPLLLFSGDAFSPSIMSTVTKGSHMVPVLNMLGIGCAMFGNHDFDFGVDVAARLADSTNFPWLLSNVFDGKSKQTLANGLRTKMLSWEGHKIGLMGLAEKEWIDTLPNLPTYGVDYADFVEEGRKLALELREQGAEVVIAITHMREPNDLLLAESVEEIDLILGGHDHLYNITHSQKYGNTVVKSGSDFRELTEIQLFFNKKAPVPKDAMKGPRMSFLCKKIEINASLPIHPEMHQIVEELTGEVNRKMNSKVGELACTLDCTFQTARSRECNAGNLMADIIRRVYKTDVGLICGGCIRSDDKYGPGDFTRRDILLIFPFEDPCVVLKLTGEQIRLALENGVSSFPKLDGRFPQVSGLRFVYDPSKPPNSRVVDVYVGKEKMIPDKFYSVATRAYMALGRDGFDVLAQGEVLMPEENGHLLSVLLRNFFWRVELINRMHARKWKPEFINSAVKAFDLDTFKDADVQPVTVNPKVEGRILTVAQLMERKSSIRITQLPDAVDDFVDLDEPTDEPEEAKAPSA